MQRLAGRSPEKAFRFRAAAVAFSLLLLLVLLIMPRKLPPGVTVLKNKAGMEVHILSTGKRQCCIKAGAMFNLHKRHRNDH